MKYEMRVSATYEGAREVEEFIGTVLTEETQLFRVLQIDLIALAIFEHMVAQIQAAEESGQQGDLGEFWLDLLLSSEDVTILVRDDGEESELDLTSFQELTPENIHNGYGLVLLNKLCNHIGQERKEDWNIWSFRFHRDAYI